MALGIQYDVDFTGYHKDLITQALDRMLSQHYNKCVLRQFVAAFIRQCQELYDACIDMQRLRIPYNAEGENLDALGRIVGEDRTPWMYDESGWMFFDRQGQGWDQVPVWVRGGPLGTSAYVDDIQYRTNIIIKAIKNHTLTSSIPEITELIRLIFGIYVAFDKLGPNQVQIIVSSNISMQQLILLTYSWDNTRVDHAWYMNYPVTLDISKVMFAPYPSPFTFDIENLGWDDAYVAVGVHTQ